jgi:hypothetical protein
MPESECWDDICSPIMADRSSFSDALSRLLAGANGLSPWRFFVFNAASIHRVAGPAGWGLLAVALTVGFVMWRYYKNHEESLLAKAELEMKRQHSR